MTDTFTVFTNNLFDHFEEGVTNAAPDVAGRIRAVAPVDTGETRDSIDHQFTGRFSFDITASTEQAAIQNAGAAPFEIRRRTKKGLTLVQHPGFSKHKGWWTDAPWEQWASVAFATHL